MRTLILSSLILIITNLYAQDSINIIYYPLNEIYDIYVPDESGLFNRGLAINTEPASDRFGQRDKALFFRGNSYIKFDALKFDFNTYSYCMWVKIIEQPDWQTAQFIFDIGSEYGVDQYLAYTYGYSNYNLDGFLGQGYNTNYTSSWISQGNLVIDEQWHFLVYTRGADYIKLYFDSIIIDSLYIKGLLPIYGENIKGYVGCRNNLDQFFNGYIDDIRLYNYNIEKSTIDSLYTILPTNISTINETKISIYPNPAEDKLNLILSPNNKDFTASIYNILGDLVLTSVNTKIIDIKQLCNGLYILKIVENKSRNEKSLKFIKN